MGAHASALADSSRLLPGHELRPKHVLHVAEEKEAEIAVAGVGRPLLEHIILILKTKFPDTYETMTTKEVCAELVLPETQETKQSLATLLFAHKGLKHYVGRATVFVSHAWKYSFWAMIQTVLRYEAEEKPGALFWIDLIANNQHNLIHPYEWWASTFGCKIASIGHVLLVMSPWQDPIPMKRCWCLFEIMNALQNHVTLDIRLPASEEASFLEALTSSGKGVIDMLVRVQADKAEAYSAQDKKNIFAAISDGLGFVELNTRVKAQLREWCLEQGEVAIVHARQASGMTQEFGALCFQMGSVMKDFGEHDKAIEHYGHALSVLSTALGRQHPDVARTYNNMAIIFARQGHHKMAIAYYKKALAIMVPTLGEQHPDVAVTYNNIANVFELLGDYDKALEYFGKDLEICVANGENDPSTSSTYNNMAIVFQAQGLYDKALEYFSKSLSITIATVGDQHPSTASTYNNMAEVYKAKGNMKTALDYYNKALKIWLVTLGEHHPDTEQVRLNIMKACKTQFTKFH